MDSDINNTIEKAFRENRKGRKLVIFGAGQEGKNFIEAYGEFISPDSYIVDNNPKLWDSVRYGLPVMSPETLKNEDCDSILLIVAMSAYFQVVPQIRKYGITGLFFFHEGSFFDPYATEVNDFSNVLLRLETTAHCNFSCTFCTHADMNRPKGIMEDTLFKRMISEASSLGFRKLDIRNFGEPLLDKKLEERVRFAKKSGFTNIFLYTNAMLLNQDRYASLAEAGLDRAIVSLSPKEEFEKTRKGVAYSYIIDNLKGIHLQKTTKIQIDLVAPDSSQAECEQTEHELRELGFENIVKVHIHNWGTGTENLSDYQAAYIPCRRVWDSVTVFWDGRVPLCCLDYEGDEILGDLSSDSLESIINSDKYQEMRKRQLIGHPPKMCLTCTNFK